jgi:lysophospholipid acyltransferase (LPLAT)-like uncharacterized protein
MTADHHPTAGATQPHRVIPHRLPWLKQVLATFVFLLIRLIACTLRFRFDDRSGLFQSKSADPAIFAIWHNRLSLSLIIYLKYCRQRQPERRMAAIVSASRDGAVVAHILKLFNVQPVRGSTSRRGPQALLELTSWAERGFDLAITPDGPRGPCYGVQPGVVSLAQLTTLPILPAGYHVSWKLRAHNWDRFLIPLPFARVDVTLGELVRVPRDADATERETCRRLLEERMRAITRD